MAEIPCVKTCVKNCVKNCVKKYIVGNQEENSFSHVFPTGFHTCFQDSVSSFSHVPGGFSLGSGSIVSQPPRAARPASTLTATADGGPACRAHPLAADPHRRVIAKTTRGSWTARRVLHKESLTTVAPQSEKLVSYSCEQGGTTFVCRAKRA